VEETLKESGQAREEIPQERIAYLFIVTG